MRGWSRLLIPIGLLIGIGVLLLIYVPLEPLGLIAITIGPIPIFSLLFGLRDL
jgi:hypothetical protein